MTSIGAKELSSCTSSTCSIVSKRTTWDFFVVFFHQLKWKYTLSTLFIRKSETAIWQHNTINPASQEVCCCIIKRIFARETPLAQRSQRVMSSRHRSTDQMEANAGSVSAQLHPPNTSKSGSKSRERPSKDNSTGANNTAKSASFRLLTVSPRPEDILCGRGLHIMNRTGNLSLHLLVNSYREKYQNSTRRDKAELVRQIVQEIKSSGARFLRRVDDESGRDGRWVEVDYKTAFRKISHALRLRPNDHGRKFKKAAELQQNMDSTEAPTVAHTPPQIPEAPSLPQRDLDNAPNVSSSSPVEGNLLEAPSSSHNESDNAPSVSSSPSQDVRLPYCPSPAYQLQSLLGPNPPPPVYFGGLRPEAQLLPRLPLLNINGYLYMVLDPRLVANAFTTTLATMGASAHQQSRLSLDGRESSSPASSKPSGEERRN